MMIREELFILNMIKDVDEAIMLLYSSSIQEKDR